MAVESSPAFQFYVKEWRSSRAIQRMSMAERGMYLEMLMEQWENLSLPDDPRAVADLIGGATEAEWIAAWPALRRKFCDRRSPTREGTMHATNYADPSTWDAHKKVINVKLEEIRRAKKRYKKLAKIGGRARAAQAKRGHDGTYHPAVTPAVPPAVTPAVHPGVSSTPTASPTASASASPTPSVSPSLTFVTRARTTHTGRIFLHRWQVDALIDTLGPHAEGFGLDAWLDALSRTPGVLPKDRWAWVQAQLDAEVRARGLPIADTPATAPTHKRIAGLMAGGQAFLDRGRPS